MSERSRVASCGNPAAEYRALKETSGLFRLDERGVLRASGPSRLKFLQGMLTNDVAGRPPGRGCRAALLNVKGAVQALLRVLVEDEDVVMETDLDRVSFVQGTFEHHRVAAPVRFEPHPTSLLALLGPRAEDVLRATGLPSPPPDGESHTATTVASQAVRVVRATDLPGGGFVLHAAPEAEAAVWNALQNAGARPVGRDALDARRVETLRPWYGVDVTGDNLLHETGLVAECHSPAKGCYLGQEVVARLEARGGNVSRALRGLRLEAPTSAGSPVTVDGAEVGRVTTAAVSPRRGPIALAYVHRNHFAPGAAVRVDGLPATVVTAFDEA